MVIIDNKKPKHYLLFLRRKLRAEEDIAAIKIEIKGLMTYHQHVHSKLLQSFQTASPGVSSALFGHLCNRELVMMKLVHVSEKILGPKLDIATPYLDMRPVWGENHIQVDPLLQDIEEHNFHLLMELSDDDLSDTD